MFDDFYFEDKFHPWDVKSLEEFRNYCCPECPAKYVNKTDFIKHAVTAHPQSQSTIEDLEDNNEAIIKTENVFSSATESTNHNHEETLSFTYTSGNSCIPATCQQNNEQNVAQSEVHSLQNDHHQLIKKVLDAHALRPNDMVISNTSSQADNTFEEPNDNCRKSFSQKTTWNQHIKSVLENVRYNCKKCEKRFSTKYTLYKHIKSVHENVRYNCDKCAKNFATKYTLYTHIKSVHENVRYNCDKCEKSFTLKTSLNTHNKSAHEYLRYHCNKCGKGFPWWGDLNTHIKSVHENLRCNCDKCEESFYQNFLLNEHI